MCLVLRGALQLSLVADTLGEYKKCEGLPEMASAIKRIVAALPTRGDAPAIKQGHSVGQYEHLGNDELIAVAKNVAGQIDDSMQEWRSQVHDVRLRYDEQIYYQSPPLADDERQRLEAARVEQLKAIDQTYETESKDLLNSGHSGDAG